MGLGDFEAAWRVSDRIVARRAKATRDDPRLPYHMRWLWDGRPFDGKRVLVRCYHGLGDTVQFCRFLAPLRSRTQSLTLEVQPELVELLSRLDGPDELVAFRPAHPLPASECDLEIMELSHALRLAPRLFPYLMNTSRSARSGFRVGLCWQASPGWLPERSLPARSLAPLFQLCGIEYVSLARETMVPPGLRDDCPDSIVETAKRIAALDLVISVDTMVAHLAGALGTPLWLLLKAEPDWRWLGGGTGSIWYPRVRKFVQSRPGDWEVPLQRIASGLKAVARDGTLEI